MQPNRQGYALTSESGGTSDERFDTIADVLDYAQQTGLAAGSEAVITGTSWPGLIIRVAKI